MKKKRKSSTRVTRHKTVIASALTILPDALIAPMVHPGSTLHRVCRTTPVWNALNKPEAREMHFEPLVARRLSALPKLAKRQFESAGVRLTPHPHHLR
jgi:hypothetical protein